MFSMQDAVESYPHLDLAECGYFLPLYKYLRNPARRNIYCLQTCVYVYEEGAMIQLNLKKMGFADKAIFILGLALCGVVAFVLVAGVLVALLKWLLEGKPVALEIHAVPELEGANANGGTFVEGGDPRG